MNQIEISSSVRVLQHPVRVLTASQVDRYKIHIPFKVFALMVLVALVALCISVGLRTQAEMRHALQNNQETRQYLSSLQKENLRLSSEVDKLNLDSKAIEQAARNMGMVKKDEVVVVFNNN